MSSTDPYAVKQIRGPLLKLPEHSDHCTTEEELRDYCRRRRSEGAVLGADLFSGAGGLSLGLMEAGIEVVFGVDHYSYAVETHSAYFPGMSVEWDLSTPQSVERVADLMTECGIEVLAGGPPCQPFSKAGRSGIRSLVEKGLRDPRDTRRDLWRAYLEVVQLARPRAVIMENVPDMALDKEMFILRSMIEELEMLGYAVEERVVDAWRYGVPQFRQRLILVALRDGVKYEWPEERKTKVTVWNTIGDMPEVEGGWRPEAGAEGWIRYPGPVTETQRYLRRRVSEEDRHKLYDHITRPVRDDDRIAFEMMTSDTKYSDLPDHLRRYRSDIFDDKYKRLDEDDLSRTITAHIAKDGYSFIHPRQSRTLTVREAARIQTFPDDFRFSGPPSAAFRQIGNAVPVRLGEAVGRAVMDSLRRGEKKPIGARATARHLAEWYRGLDDRDLMYPWARSGSRFRAVVAEILTERAAPATVRSVWQGISSLPDVEPGFTVPEKTREAIRFLVGPNYGKRLERVERLFVEMDREPEALWAPHISRSALPSLTPALIDFLELAIPVADESGEFCGEPVIAGRGILRITSCFLDRDTESRNRNSSGRLSVAQMLGMNVHSREAHLALFEIARSKCTPNSPECGLCPDLKGTPCVGGHTGKEVQRSLSLSGEGFLRG